MPARLTIIVATGLSLLLFAMATASCGDEASAAPPDWLLERVTRMARGSGDEQASSWWTLTTAEKAVVVADGDGPSQAADPDRPVYVVIFHGDFTSWGMWSAPEDGLAKDYKWFYVLIDAESRNADGAGASGKPFDTSGLTMQPVRLLQGPTEQTGTGEARAQAWRTWTHLTRASSRLAEAQREAQA